MKISISFKTILSSVHKPTCLRKQPASLECLLYLSFCGMVGLGLCKVLSSFWFFHTVNGASSFDLNFRGFQASAHDRIKAAFQTLAIFSIISHCGSTTVKQSMIPSPGTLHRSNCRVLLSSYSFD